MARAVWPFAALAILSGCSLFRGAIGTAWETAVTNSSAAGIVVAAQDTREPRYYAVLPGATVVVDVSAHGNLATEDVLILDPTCAERGVVHGDFTEGALIHVTDTGVESAFGREISGAREPDNTTGEASCQEAAAQL